MPTLEFKGKPFVYSHHLSVPFRELIVDKKKSHPGGNKASLDDNLIIHGDNLEALKALLPRYAGKVDVIYIDPPYNTGKKDWAYNDDVNSPLMREWLGKIVDRDDLERHDKWLCMMWPRLQLLKELLKPGGILFVSVDDNELHHLKQILEETWEAEGWLGTIVWKNATDNNPTNIAVEHEYIHAFAHDIDKVAPEWKSPHAAPKNVLLEKERELLSSGDALEAMQAKYKAWFRTHKRQLAPLQEYDQIDKGGIFTGSRSVHNPGREGYRWELTNPKTGRPVPQPLMGYRFPESTRDELLADDRIIFSEDPKKLIEIKVYLREFREKMPGLIEIDGRRGANELRSIFPEKTIAFKNPKTYTLIEWLLSYSADNEAVILDSFAGSGTTAHAVLALNHRDGGNRRFILVETEDYADTLTAERVRRVIKGVSKTKDITLGKGLGGSFTFCELGDPIDLERFFDGKGAPNYEQVARYVVYTATGQSAADAPETPRKDWFVAEAGGYRIHLIYRPDLDFMRSNDAALSIELAQSIAKSAKGKPALVYAAAKFMSQAALTAIGITFCQLPYSIHRVLGEAPDAP